MSALFTDDDVGKTVENENGVRVGAVASVQGDVAHVRPDPAAVDSVKSSLGWESGGTETYPLESASVREITDEAVRLEGEFPEPEAPTDRVDSAIEAGGPDSGTGTDRGPEVDPSALTERDSELEVDPDDPDRRTDAEVAPSADRRRTDAEVDPDSDRRRTDAEVDPDDAARRDDAEVDPDDG